MNFNLPALLCGLSGALAGSIVLDSGNFTAISNGTWFVKFYAPWCRYSKKLAPEWRIMSNTLDNLTEKEFYFGEVDCNSNGKICEENQIDGYPTLKLFDKGELVEEFDQDSVTKLTATNISPYAIKMADKYYKPHAPPAPKVDPPTMPKEPLDSGFVVEIDPKTFPSIVSSSNPWAVLFYSPTCPHCRAMEPLYIDAALKSKNRLNFAKIDCVEYSAFCQERQVAGVPDMRILLQDKQLGKNMGELPLPKLLKFVQKFYVPKTAKKTLQEVQAKIELHTTSFTTRPFLVLASNTTATESDFKGIISNLVGAGLSDEITILEDPRARETFKLNSSPVAMFLVHGSKVVEFNHPLGSADVLKAWAASTEFPLASQIQHQFISEMVLEDYHLIVGMHFKASHDDSSKLKELTLQANINYLQTLGQTPLMANTSLLKPVLFTFIDGPVDNEPQKQLLSDLKLPVDDMQKHVQEVGSEALFVLIDSSTRKYFYLDSKTENKASPETVVSFLKAFQQDKLEAMHYVLYLLAAILLVAVLAWYIKKAKSEPEIQYSRVQA